MPRPASILKKRQHDPLDFSAAPLGLVRSPYRQFYFARYPAQNAKRFEEREARKYTVDLAFARAFLDLGSK
jgi:hypothetical protein